MRKTVLAVVVVITMALARPARAESDGGYGPWPGLVAIALGAAIGLTIHYTLLADSDEKKDVAQVTRPLMLAGEGSLTQPPVAPGPGAAKPRPDLAIWRF
jgi:hypothetical protein